MGGGALARVGRRHERETEGSAIHRDWFQLFAVSAVVMGLAHTIAKERVFAWLRHALGGKETYLGYLVSCPYCASHWIAFVLVPVTGAYSVDVPHAWGAFEIVIEWFLSSIFVVVLAAFLRVGFYFVDETQGLMRRRQRTEEEEARLVHEEAEIERERLARLERERVEGTRADRAEGKGVGPTLQ